MYIFFKATSSNMLALQQQSQSVRERHVVDRSLFTVHGTHTQIKRMTQLTKKDTIQNFQLDSVRFFTYSSNMFLIWSTLWRVTGTPVAGSCDWHTLCEQTKHANEWETSMVIPQECRSLTTWLHCWVTQFLASTPPFPSASLPCHPSVSCSILHLWI